MRIALFPDSSPHTCPIGASLSEPHTSGTALHTCVYVCLLVAIYRKLVNEASLYILLFSHVQNRVHSPVHSQVSRFRTYPNKLQYVHQHTWYRHGPLDTCLCGSSHTIQCCYVYYISHSCIWSILWTHSKHCLPRSGYIMGILRLVEYSCVLCMR